MGDEEGKERERERERLLLTRSIGYRDVVERNGLPLLSAPRLYGERVPVKLLRTSNSKVRQKIVDTHNYLRTQVKPPAANMLVMVSGSIVCFLHYVFIRISILLLNFIKKE